MKELTIEEKVKAYDNIIEKANKMHIENCEACQMCIEELLPELQESEDERIRKALIKYYSFDKAGGSNALDNITPKQIVTWLKKQDGQKSNDNAEPKFKVGDWIINSQGTLRHIINIDKGGYQTDGGWLSHDTYEKTFHLWTIKDAKAGDVLSFNDGHGNDCIELIKSITDKKIEFWFCLTNGNRYEVFDEVIPYTNLASREDATPATKSQREQLEKAITEAGYDWDAEKKKLRKIEQKPKFRVGDTIKCKYDDRQFTIKRVDLDKGTYTYTQEGCGNDIDYADEEFELVEQKPTEWSLPYGKNETAEKLIALAECLEADGECLFNGLSGDDYGKFLRVLAIELTQPKQKWSEEDEYYYSIIQYILNNECVGKTDKENAISWLKSLKNRIHSQPKQEWSEEDETVLNNLIYALANDRIGNNRDEYVGWLKSLRPQNRWKPSELQIEALESATENCAYSEYQDCLKELIGQLKKLREE